MTDSVLATRIMIFLSEDDRVGRQGLHDVLLDRARDDGLAGASVWRIAEGFGQSGHFRTGRFPDAAIGLPLALEIIDLPERVEAFLPTVRQLAPHSVVTREQVEMIRATDGDHRALDDPEPPA